MQRSGLKYLIASAVLTAVLFGHWNFAQAQRARHAPANTSSALARELAAARRAGLLLRLQDMQAPLPPPDQNAAPLYTQLDALLKTKPLGPTDDADVSALGRRRTTPDQIAKARAVLACRRDVLALIHRAAARPQCVFKRDWSKGERVLFPEYANMRLAARWIKAESLLLMQDGKPLEAVRNQALGFRIARQASGDPLLIAYLVAGAIDQITFFGLEQMLYRSDSNPAIAAAVRQAIERDWRPARLSHGLRGELPMLLDLLQRIRHDGVEWVREAGLFEDSEVQAIRNKYGGPGERLNGWVDANEASMITALWQILAAADRPYPKIAAQMQALTAAAKKMQRPAQALASVWIPAWAQLPTTQVRYQARAQVVRCGAAVLAWKARHGALPTALSPVPTDPFDGKPLRYKREGGGFVVYSVGETGHFDGGAPNVKPDSKEALFRYPMPPYWK